MSTVMQILRSKQDNTVFTTSPGATVTEAARLMAEKHIGGLLVMEKERIIGIVTERDIKTIPEGMRRVGRHQEEFLLWILLREQYRRSGGSCGLPHPPLAAEEDEPQSLMF